MPRKVKGESYSVYMQRPGFQEDEPYLPTGVDLEPEIHPRDEILLNANSRLLEFDKLTKASIMPSNQALDNDTHISSVDDTGLSSKPRRKKAKSPI